LRASAYQPPVSADVRRQASHRRCLAGIAALKNSVVGEVRKTPYWAVLFCVMHRSIR